MKTSYVCSNCGYKTSKWLGKCPECGEWNTFIEEIEIPKKEIKKSEKIYNQPININEIEINTQDRIYTGLYEFDRVLGGFVRGQAILLSGEPGVGKSTLLIQIANILSKKLKVLYISGEESYSQIKIRAKRLNINSNNLFLLAESNLENILFQIEKFKPDIVILDSIQTTLSEEYQSFPGSVVQIRECVNKLVYDCKTKGYILIIIGHITKSGIIAGPKIMEHIVDTVIFIESDKKNFYRILRSNKNRFHTTEEIGFFSISEDGMEEVRNIENTFRNNHINNVCGVSIYPYIEGSRVIPLETQALCVPTQFNFPKRACDGIDLNRLYLLTAIMEKNLKINLSSHDIYLNITGGMNIYDPSIDLSVIISIYSSFKNIPFSLDYVVFGEVGLTGEVRSIFNMEKRINEMIRIGFKKIIIPFNNNLKIKNVSDVHIYPVKTIMEAIQIGF